MPINLVTKTDTNFAPYLKYNAKSGRWYTKKESGSEIEIVSLVGAFDLENIKTGWVKFSEGNAPDMIWDEGGVQAEQPTPTHKRGFLVSVTLQGYGVREFSSNSINAINAIVKLHNAYEQDHGEHPGMVPVVACSGITPVKNKFGTNYQPEFEIVQWIDRDEVEAVSETPKVEVAKPPQAEMRWQSRPGSAPAYQPVRPARKDELDDSDNIPF